jgi:cytochrome d ubiquinol oxidase subunit II
MAGIIAFCVVAGMLTVYTLLDGYDLGAGAIALVLAKTRPERTAIIESIGPFWSGNEVWLVAAGGALFALFPKVYAVSFSGFYLPFIIVLWLLMFRGIAIELREHLPGNVWLDFWDTAFSLSSLLLIVLFGVALGNLVRGLPLNADGYFFGTFSSLLNPYAVAVGVLAVVALVQHGLAYLAANIAGQLGERALRLAGCVWWAVLVVFLAVTATTIVRFRAELPAPPLAFAAGTIALLALLAMRAPRVRDRPTVTFRMSLLFLAGLLVAASATMYPYLIRPYPGPAGGLTIFNAASPPSTLAISLPIAIAGLIVVVAYSIFVHRQMPARVAVRDEPLDQGSSTTLM